MWPFKKKKIKRDLLLTLMESNSKESKAIVEVIKSLASGDFVEDSKIKSVVLGYFDKMQSNCDSVAQGQLSILSTVCLFRPCLARELLGRPMQALYYLGLERIDDIKKYLEWFINYEEPYLGRGSDESYQWLKEFSANGDEIIKQAFRNMYDKEDNDWREDVPDIVKS